MYISTHQIPRLIQRRSDFQDLSHAVLAWRVCLAATAQKKQSLVRRQDGWPLSLWLESPHCPPSETHSQSTTTAFPQMSVKYREYILVYLMMPNDKSHTTRAFMPSSLGSLLKGCCGVLLETLSLSGEQLSSTRPNIGSFPMMIHFMFTKEAFRTTLRTSN